VANQVANLASKDSALNRMAATEGLKAVNRRGLLNSTMGIEASRDAVLKNVLPIAQQDASQAFQKNMAARGFEYSSAANQQTQGWQTAENIAQRGFAGTQAQLDRDLQNSLQQNQISSAESMQLKAIASAEGIEAANRALSTMLQEKDIQFRMTEGGLNRDAAVAAQQADIAFQKEQGALNRDLQEQIAKWNLSSTDKANAGQFLTNMETMYQSTYQSIMANTSLDKKTRDSYLTAAKNMRNGQINFVEQLYNVDLKW
jgi:hypothetical protein